MGVFEKIPIPQWERDLGIVRDGYVCDPNTFMSHAGTTARVLLSASDSVKGLMEKTSRRGN